MLTLADVIEALTGHRPAAAERQVINTTVIDSREAVAGSLFVALLGERQDGHSFIAEAFTRGAIAALAEERAREQPLPASFLDARTFTLASPLPPPPVCLIVDNSLRALQRLAAHWRGKFDVRVIGITGSVGKSSTKELTWAVLSRCYKTLKNPGNLNNEIGLPLTLLRLHRQHQKVILEMGMYDIGEIAGLCAIARPQVGVITNVGPTHLERLGTLERVAQAKAELVEALPADGTAILNIDDPFVQAMAGRTRARVMTYGLAPGADLWADDVQSKGLEGVRFRLHYGREVLHVKVPLLGRHSVHTSLRAAAVGLVEGESWEEIVAGLQDVSAQLRLVAVPGPAGSTILDDTYNASPTSTIAALNLLEELPAGRKIAVLGDMRELGSYQEEGHRKVGARAADVVALLITVGPLAGIIADEARRSGLPAEAVMSMTSNEEAIAALNEIVGPGDMILVKGSRSMQMEGIVAALSRAINNGQQGDR
jgi:UDP-N-acetylmuramoyl-tripeptide--D-alanyl-D-alanine ligase